SDPVLAGTVPDGQLRGQRGLPGTRRARDSDPLRTTQIRMNFVQQSLEAGADVLDDRDRPGEGGPLPRPEALEQVRGRRWSFELVHQTNTGCVRATGLLCRKIARPGARC